MCFNTAIKPIRPFSPASTADVVQNPTDFESAEVPNIPGTQSQTHA